MKNKTLADFFHKLVFIFVNDITYTEVLELGMQTLHLQEDYYWNFINISAIIRAPLYTTIVNRLLLYG